jgi:hypothetical protein
MQRPGRRQPDPRDDDTGFFDRIKAAASGLFERLRGEPPRQAMPLERARGQVGPVVPYHERRQQLRRHRARRDSSYALVFIVILLVLVIGIFYGLSWALSGLGFGSSGARATPTAVAPPVAVGPSPSPSPVALPPAGPGLPQPSPSPGPGGEPGTAGPAQPGSSPTTGQTYVVKAGDSPASIAAQFGITAQQLMQANGITDPRSLQVGQRLNIPAR